MDLMTLASNKKRPLIRRISRPSPINSLDHDVLSAIFSFLDDCFHLTNCSLVFKTWSSVITKSKLLAGLYYKQWLMGLVKGLCLEEMAVEPHRLALQQSRRRMLINGRLTLLMWTSAGKRTNCFSPAAVTSWVMSIKEEQIPNNTEGETTLKLCLDVFLFELQITILPIREGFRSGQEQQEEAEKRTSADQCS
ncbi:hypothetical protein ACLB2K_016239 [Fragaria x ananassa]